MGTPLRSRLLALLALCLLWAQSHAQNDLGSLLAGCPAGWTIGTQPACMFRAPAPLPYRDSGAYSVTVPSNPSYDLVITVVSIDGDVDIKLLGPDKSVVASSAERIGEDLVYVRRADLAKLPGNYTLVITAVGGQLSWYSYTVQGVTNAPRLVATEVELMRSIMAQCCSADDDILPDACTVLRAATADNVTAEVDLCATPPNNCDNQGRLVKLSLSGGDKGNFVCPSFPVELGQLSALQVLDWTNNGQVGELASVVSVMGPALAAGRLKRLYLGYNAFSGPLDCGLLDKAGLEVLWLDYNLLSGTLPACYFASPTLLQLSLAGNLLNGPLPDLPQGCSLVTLDLSANGPPLGATPVNPGFTGPLPSSLTNAANLAYLDVSSNSLEGALPAVPQKLQLFRASYNDLTGPLPVSLQTANDLRVLDLSRNQLTGNLSSELTNNALLTVLRLAGNQMGGELPQMGFGDYLIDVDLSENNFSGGYTKLAVLPSIIRLNLAFNNLSLDMQEVARATAAKNSMLYFNVSNNILFGQLAQGIGRMRLFNSLQLTPDDDQALMGSAPPQPVFDISSNRIASTFPIWMLPLLGSLFWQSPYDYIPLSLKLQPQQDEPATDPRGATPGLTCPPPATTLPGDAYYLNELQGLYDLTCLINSNQHINISSYSDMSLRPALPPKPPGPPRPPPPAPPRPPRRKPPNPSPAASNNAGGIGSAPAPAPQGSGSGSGTGTGPQGAGGSGSNSNSTGTGSGSGTGNGAGSGSGVNGGGTGSGGTGEAAVTTTDGGKKSGSMIIIIAAAAGGAALLIILLGGWWWWRRRQARESTYAAKRVPLTHNTAYEAPSEGTASNYGELQMFEFRADRPARHRGRMA